MTDLPPDLVETCRKMILGSRWEFAFENNMVKHNIEDAGDLMFDILDFLCEAHPHELLTRIDHDTIVNHIEAPEEHRPEFFLTGFSHLGLVDDSEADDIADLKSAVATMASDLLITRIEIRRSE